MKGKMINKTLYKKPFKIVWNTIKGIIATPCLVIGLLLLTVGMMLMGETWGE